MRRTPANEVYFSNVLGGLMELPLDVAKQLDLHTGDRLEISVLECGRLMVTKV